jgi:hypothetical protein
MHVTVLGYIIASIVSAIVSVIDLSLARDKGLYRAVTLLFLLYVSFDVATSLILCTPIEVGAKLLQSDPVEAAGVVAGLISALLMRTKVTIPFLKSRPDVNAIAILRKLQIKVSVEINERCAVAETDWVLDRVLPSLSVLTLTEVEQWAVQALVVKFNEPDQRAMRDDRIADIHAAGEDAGNEPESKRLIVQILQDTGGRRLVVGLMNRAKRKSAAMEGAAHRGAGPPRLQLPGSSRGLVDPAEVGGQEDAEASADGQDAEASADGQDAEASADGQDAEASADPQDADVTSPPKDPEVKE